MKKYLTLIIAVLLLTGCTASKNDIVKEIDKYIELSSSLAKHQPNYLKEGYKYYVPVNGRVLYGDESNDVLVINGEEVVMYVDLVEYLYKKPAQVSYSVTKSSTLYYDRTFDKGFIKISRSGDKFSINMKYNQSYLTATTSESNLPHMIANMLLMGSSVEMYDDVVPTIVGKIDAHQFTEKLTTFEPMKDRDTYEDYYQEYVESAATDSSEKIGLPSSDSKDNEEDNPSINTNPYKDSGTGE